jgi:hypothetical protein
VLNAGSINTWILPIRHATLVSTSGISTKTILDKAEDVGKVSIP